MIGTSGAGIAFTVWWFFWRKRLGRIEALEAAVFGADGVRNRYVTRPEFERSVGELNTRMAGLSDEGQAREERILQAIERNTLVVGSEVREMKADVRETLREFRADMRAQTTRIDAAIAVAHKPPER
jgi:hypothetical protein